MMRKIIENPHGHTLKNQKILKSKKFSCAACSQGKLVIKPSTAKVGIESPSFLKRIQGDICGSIHPPCGPFKYYMILIDASTRLSHVCLLSTRNMDFARLWAQIIRLRAQFSDYAIKTFVLITLVSLHCKSLMIIVCPRESIKHPVAHIHTQNGLAEFYDWVSPIDS